VYASNSYQPNMLLLCDDKLILALVSWHTEAYPTNWRVNSFDTSVPEALRIGWTLLGVQAIRNNYPYLDSCCTHFLYSRPLRYDEISYDF
jgi:hypothetical protein